MVVGFAVNSHAVNRVAVSNQNPSVHTFDVWLGHVHFSVVALPGLPGKLARRIGWTAATGIFVAQYFQDPGPVSCAFVRCVELSQNPVSLCSVKVKELFLIFLQVALVPFPANQGVV